MCHRSLRVDTVTAQSRRFGSHGEDEMRLALEVRYLERCLEKEDEHRCAKPLQDTGWRRRTPLRGKPLQDTGWRRQTPLRGKPLQDTGQRHHELLLRRATGHHGDVPWRTWMRDLTEAKDAFQKNGNLIEVKDYHREVRSACSKKGARTSNLA
jgi:hypothetical protein